jgi:hypothetical protein
MAVQETLLEAYQLIRSAGAKLADRWPTLVALVLAGFTAKLLTLKVALLAGRVAWVLGVLVFAFTAAGLLTAIVQMFRSMFPGRPRPRFTTVLPPFLLIYVASGHFDGYPVDPALERQVTMDVAAASVLIAAVALRWLLPLWKSFGTKPWARRAKLGLDICWMSLVAFTITTHVAWQWLAGLVAPVGWIIETVVAVLIVPLAWMAVGGLSLGLRPAQVPRLIGRAGVPMLLFGCLVILLIGKMPPLLWQVERFIIGPQDPETVWLPAAGLLGAVGSALAVLLAVALVGAVLAYSGGDEAGIPGQRFPAHDAYGDRLGVGGRGEEDGHLVRT